MKVNPELLKWARDRAHLDVEDLSLKFPKLVAWEREEELPTLRQLEKYAHATHVAVGYLFLSRPPEEPMPIPDFRTMAGREVVRPSANLLDTLYVCQERQNWFRDFARTSGLKPLEFVGSAKTSMPVEWVANRMRETLGFDLDTQRSCGNWTEALRQFIGKAEQAGVMVMVNGVVRNNTHRALDPEEFRGFAMSDPLAPLVFINGADTKAAQMFTLAHELAHLWLGASALSNVNAGGAIGLRDEEDWCNRVAGEFLVPRAAFGQELRTGEGLEIALSRLARTFKVSTLVILRRLRDVGSLTPGGYRDAYDRELGRLLELDRAKEHNGGDFYRVLLARTSQRFTRAVLESTLEGHTLYRDALHMLGFSKIETFHRLGRNLGILL